jgi:hypothetical protein
MFSNFCFFTRAVNKLVWTNMVEPERPQMTAWRMRISLWIPQAANTLTEYAILNAFPL